MEINKDYLNSILENLSLYRPFFHSESDFQHELALFLSINCNKEIRLEKPFLNIPLNNFATKKIKVELDILLIKEKVGIELKYKTINKNISFNNEEFKLKNHGAQNLGRFDFFDDLRRLQILKKNDRIDSGYVIFLTNDPLYWRPITRNNFSKEFSMEEGRHIKRNSILSWIGNPGENSVTSKRLGEFSKIEIDNDSSLVWNNYSKIEGNEFKHLIVEV